MQTVLGPHKSRTALIAPPGSELKSVHLRGWYAPQSPPLVMKLIFLNDVRLKVDFQASFTLLLVTEDARYNIKARFFIFFFQSLSSSSHYVALHPRLHGPEQRGSRFRPVWSDTNIPQYNARSDNRL